MSNTVIPAAATGLPSRRRALASLAGLGAALSLPATAHAISCEPVVAELAQLYAAARRRGLIALDACNVADKRLKRPEIPAALFAQPDDPLARVFAPTPRIGKDYWYGDAERIDLLRSWDAKRLNTSAWWAPVLARREEVLAADDGWRAAFQAAEDAAGVTAASAEYRAAWNDEEKPVRLRILALRSTDPAVLRLKVLAYIDAASDLDWRAALDKKIDRAIEEEGGPWEDAFAASIVRDIVTSYAEVDA